MWAMAEPKIQGNIGQMLLFFKIDKQGEEVIWKPFGENYHSLLFWKCRWSNDKDL